MDWTTFIGPTIAPALIAGAVALFVVWINRKTTLRTHAEKLGFDRLLAREKLEADQKLAERKVEADIALAERKFRLDMQAQDRRRRQELAEELIAGFLEVQDIMQSVRSPIGYLGEGSSRQKEDSETPDQTKRRNARFVIHERYNKHREAVARLASREYRAVAWFGVEAREPFKTLLQAINEVFIANEELAEEDEYSGSDRATRERRIELRRIISWRGDENDRIAAQIQDAVRQIEAICRPVLEEAT